MRYLHPDKHYSLNRALVKKRPSKPMPEGSMIERMAQQIHADRQAGKARG